MKTFEYKEIKWHYAGNLIDKLNELGNEGWRVCGFNRADSDTSAQIILMRERAPKGSKRKPVAPNPASKRRYVDK